MKSGKWLVWQIASRHCTVSSPLQDRDRELVDAIGGPPKDSDIPQIEQILALHVSVRKFLDFILKSRFSL